MDLYPEGCQGPAWTVQLMKKILKDNIFSETIFILHITQNYSKIQESRWFQLVYFTWVYSKKI